MATAGPSIVERVRAQKERVHVSIGAVCNNNCIFCMEEDREAREVNNGAMTPERVRWILEEHRGAEEVCFTSGEPTTRPELPDFVKWAKALGYRRISIMTNGRRSGHFPYAVALAMFWNSRFFRAHGFVPVKRSELPPEAACHAELADPAFRRSAVMLRRLTEGAP